MKHQLSQEGQQKVGASCGWGLYSCSDRPIGLCRSECWGKTTESSMQAGSTQSGRKRRWQAGRFSRSAIHARLSRSFGQLAESPGVLRLIEWRKSCECSRPTAPLEGRISTHASEFQTLKHDFRSSYIFPLCRIIWRKQDLFTKLVKGNSQVP